MLARISKLSKANNLRIFLLLTKFESLQRTYSILIETMILELEQPPPFERNACYKNRSAKKQATKWPGRISRNSGRVSAQTASAMGQRVRKRQPEGGFTGDGTSPWRMTRFRFASAIGSGIGTADNSACV